MGKRKVKSGFTLIELIVVVLLLSIVTGLAVPRFKRTFSELQLKSSAFNLYKMLQFARDRAIVEGARFRIHFDFERRSYRLLKAPDKEDRTPAYKITPGRFGKKIVLPETIRIEGHPADLTCYPDGTCMNAAIRLSGEGGAFEVLISGLGGVVRIREADL